MNIDAGRYLALLHIAVPVALVPPLPGTIRGWQEQLCKLPKEAPTLAYWMKKRGKNTGWQ